MKTFVSNRIPTQTTDISINSLLVPIINYAHAYEKGEFYKLTKEEIQSAHETCYMIINFRNRDEFLIIYDTIKSELIKINNMYLTSWLGTVSNVTRQLDTKQTFIDIMRFIKIQEIIFSYLNKYTMKFFSEEIITKQLDNQFLLLFRQNSVTLRNLIFNSIKSSNYTETHKLRLVLLNLKLLSNTIIDDFFELTCKTIQRKIIQLIKEYKKNNSTIINRDCFKNVFRYIDMFSVFVNMDEVAIFLVKSMQVDLELLNFIELKEFIYNAEENRKLLDETKKDLSKHFKCETIHSSSLQKYFPSFYRINDTLMKIFGNLILNGKGVVKRDYLKRCIEVSKERKLDSFTDFLDLTNTVNSYYGEIKDLIDDIKSSLKVFADKGIQFNKAITREIVNTLKTNNQSIILQKVAQILKIYQYFIPLKELIETFAISVILNLYINEKMINNNLQSVLFGMFEKESSKEKNYLKLVFNSFRAFNKKNKTDKLVTTEIEFVLLKKLHSIFKFQQNVYLNTLIDDKSELQNSPLNIPCDMLTPFIILETGALVMLNVHYNILKNISTKKLTPDPLGLSLNIQERLALKQLVEAKIVEEKERVYVINNTAEKSGKLVLDFFIEYIYKENTKSNEPIKNKRSENNNTLLLEKIRFLIEEISEIDDKTWKINDINRLVQTKFKIDLEETVNLLAILEKEGFFKINKSSGTVDLL